MPKRSTERRRRNKVPGETTVHREGEVKPPSLPKDTHAIARRWYQSLVESGQSEFYEPSDWAAALYVAEAMTRNLKAPRFSAQMFGAIWSAMDDLLTTESARRRFPTLTVQAKGPMQSKITRHGSRSVTD